MVVVVFGGGGWGGGCACGCCLRHRKIKCRCGLHHKRKKCYLHHRRNNAVVATFMTGRRNVVEMAVAMHTCVQGVLVFVHRDRSRKWEKGQENPAKGSSYQGVQDEPGDPLMGTYALPHPIWSVSKLTATPRLVSLKTHCHTPSGQSHCHTPSGQSLNSLPHPIWSVSKLTATPHLVSL